MSFTGPFELENVCTYLLSTLYLSYIGRGMVSKEGRPKMLGSKEGRGGGRPTDHDDVISTK